MLSLRLRLTVLGRGDAYKYAYLLVLPLNDMVIFRSFLQKTGRRRAATVCKFIIVYKLTFFVPARDAARILNPRTEGVGVQGFPVWIFVLGPILCKLSLYFKQAHNYYLLLLVCVSLTTTGQPRNSVFNSSAECSRDKPPFGFARGQDSTM